MNWTELKALNNLYLIKETKLNETIKNSGEFNYLEKSLGVIDITHRKVFALEGFAKIYENDYKRRHETYLNFLEENGFLKSQTRFEETDIKILMNINDLRVDGSLRELREQIIACDESLRGVSQMFFKNEKYLDTRSSLVSALKQILDVEQFSNEKDQQYIYKLECNNPKAIVLCENLDFLTKPNKPRQFNLELWYAGGKNVKKLEYTDTRGLPIYYSCDWDYDGLFIIYPLVKEKIPSIKLLTPNGKPKDIIESEHKSLWIDQRKETDIHLNNSQRLLLSNLIANNQWIIEESNELIKMVHYTNIV